ncbi:hypothetical protein B484DRAFT_438427, partial [Ochromonadaceae sp. CCMP2298]
NAKATHDAEIDVSDTVYKKVQSAIRRGKGIRITQGEYEGGSIFKKVKDFAKSKTGRAIGKIGQRVGQKALDYSIDKGVPMAINAGASYLSGGSVFKGSQEARDKMARLRAMRGSGIGKAFKSVGKSINKVADSKVGHSIAKISTQAGKRAISVGLPVAGTAIGSAIGTAIGGPGFGTAVGGVIGSQVGRAGASTANKKIGGRGFGIGSVRGQVRSLEDKISKKSIDPNKLLHAPDGLSGKFMERDHDIHGKGFLPIGRGFTPI